MSFCPFSKAPYIFWIDLSFSFMICLFLIFRSKIVNKIFVIYTLYSIACWKILTNFLGSSNFVSIPCIDLGAWNQRIWPQELIPYEFRLLCAIQFFPNTFKPIVELSLEGNILALFYGDGIDYCTSNGSMSKSCICFSIGFWVWDFGSFLGHLLCSHPFNFYSCFREIH